MPSKDDMLKRIRDKLAQQKQGRQRDPAEWRPPQVKANETLRVKFFVLPPMKKGDPCSTGKCVNAMDDWSVATGDHWINSRPYPCPRIYDGVQCPICEIGFTLLREQKEQGLPKEEQSKTARLWLPQTRHMVNIYFPKTKGNPDDIAGTVKYFFMPKTVYDKMEACLMAEDAGNDPDQPEAHGLFFWFDDECTIPGGFPFTLDAKFKGGYNSYETSKFIYGTGPVPLISKKGTGEAGIPADPDDAKIEEIMTMRHDLILKCAPRNLKQLEELADKLLHKTEDEVGFKEEDVAPKAAKAVKVAPKAAPVVEEVEEQVEVEEAPPEPPKKPAPAKTPAAKATKPAPKKAPEPVEDEDDPELTAMIKKIKSGDE